MSITLTEKSGKSFNPLVSIIIPVYNGANFVSEAIDSALAQTYENIEVIVINDGSTDSTESIVKKYGNKVRYFYKENGGVSTALNLGIKKSRGEYISWLSHDDLYYPTKIKSQVDVLRRLRVDQRDNTILYGNYTFIDESARKIDEFKIEKRYDVKKLEYPLYPILNCIINGCTLLIPKRCFDEAGLFNESLKTTQDYDMWLRMLPKYKLVFVPHFMVKFRIHKDQGSRIVNKSDDEVDTLWSNIYRSLSDQEKIFVDGSLARFYKIRLRFARSMALPMAEAYLIKMGGRITKSEEWMIDKKDRIINKVRRIFFRVFQ